MLRVQIIYSQSWPMFIDWIRSSEQFLSSEVELSRNKVGLTRQDVKGDVGLLVTGLG